MSYAAVGTLPLPLPLEFRVHVLAGVAGLAGRIKPVREDNGAVVPSPLVLELPAYGSHGGVSLSLWGTSLHHATDVQVLDNQVLVSVDQL